MKHIGCNGGYSVECLTNEDCLQRQQGASGEHIPTGCRLACRHRDAADENDNRFDIFRIFFFLSRESENICEQTKRDRAVNVVISGIIRIGFGCSGDAHSPLMDGTDVMTCANIVSYDLGDNFFFLIDCLKE